MTPLTLPATDGYPLGATCFGAPSSARAGVLIVPAMGVSQAFYTPFAHWLSGQGFFALCFDYRGTGRSRHGSLRGFEADVTRWAERDVAAMLAALHERLPGRQVFWVGHSLGGQVLGLVPNRELVDAAVTVAAGSGYWRENSPALKRRVWALWYLVAPVALRLFGYFPGERLRLMGDLPKGVMAQWRAWSLHPEYAPGVEGAPVRRSFGQVRCPVYALSFTDDEFLSKRNVDTLHGFFVNARVERHHVAPGEVRVQRIGHFGFFREAMQGPLWPRVGDWLAAQLEAPTRDPRP